MSYSFSVRAATKGAVLNLIEAELDKVVAGQPIHAEDRAQALDVAESFVDLIELGEGQELNVSMFGSIGAGAEGVTSAGVGVTVTAVQAATTA